MKIALVMASHEMVPLTFAYDLAQLTAYTAGNLPENVPFGINFVQGTYVHSARQDLLEAVLSHGVTHILWVDTDMRFPPDALFRLLKHNEDVVGINYSKRSLPGEFVAMKHVSWDKKGASVRLETREDSTGLEEVEAMGMGLVLMKARALQKLPSLDEQPWFFFEWLPGRRMVGEDVYFFKLLTDRGVKLYVDHDLSKVCAHTGMMEYTCEFAQIAVDARREQMAKPALVEAVAA